MTPLTPDELRKVTDKRTPAAQASALARRGVPFVYEGRRVVLDRSIALAHGLLHDVSTIRRGVNMAAVK